MSSSSSPVSAAGRSIMFMSAQDCVLPIHCISGLGGVGV